MAREHAKAQLKKVQEALDGRLYAHFTPAPIAEMEEKQGAAEKLAKEVLTFGDITGDMWTGQYNVEKAHKQDAAYLTFLAKLVELGVITALLRDEMRRDMMPPLAYYTHGGEKISSGQELQVLHGKARWVTPTGSVWCVGIDGEVRAVEGVVPTKVLQRLAARGVFAKASLVPLADAAVFDTTRLPLHPGVLANHFAYLKAHVEDLLAAPVRFLALAKVVTETVKGAKKTTIVLSQGFFSKVVTDSNCPGDVEVVATDAFVIDGDFDRPGRNLVITTPNLVCPAGFTPKINVAGAPAGGVTYDKHAAVGAPARDGTAGKGGGHFGLVTPAYTAAPRGDDGVIEIKHGSNGAVLKVTCDGSDGTPGQVCA